jgi:hypothetical protein
VPARHPRRPGGTSTVKHQRTDPRRVAMVALLGHRHGDRSRCVRVGNLAR